MSFLTPDHLIKELYVRPGSHVADVGCGTGAYTIALAREVGSTGQVYALDVHREMLHTLAAIVEKMGFLNVDTVWANIEKSSPFEKYSLDAVVVSNVLFQMDDILTALREIHDSLKPEGEILVVDWTESHGGIGPHPAHVITEARAEELLVKSGFRVMRRLPAGDYHYAIIAVSV